MAEWLCSGLQSRVRRFDSDPRLQFMNRQAGFGPRQPGFSVITSRDSSPDSCSARVVELVDTADLKSAAYLHKGRTGSIPVPGTTPDVQSVPQHPTNQAESPTLRGFRVSGRPVMCH